MVCSNKGYSHSILAGEVLIIPSEIINVAHAIVCHYTNIITVEDKNGITNFGLSMCYSKGILFLFLQVSL
jgi:hypothetical protein